MSAGAKLQVDGVQDKVLATGHGRISNNSLNVQWRILVFILVILDLFLLYLSFYSAYLVRYLSGWSLFKYLVPPSINYSEFSLMIIPVWIFIFGASGLYRHKNLLGGTREYALVFNATTLGMFVNVFAGFIFPENLLLARGWVIMAWLFSFTYISFGRFLVRRTVYGLRNKGYFQSSALLIGANNEACLIADQLMSTKTAGLRIAGFVKTDKAKEDTIDGLACLGDLDDIDVIIRQRQIRALILISSALSQDQVLAMFRKFGTLKNVDLRMTTGLYEIITTGLQVKEDGMVPLVVINKVRLTEIEQFMKLILDYCLTIPLLIVLIPIFLIIGIAIKLDSPGPIIYLRRVMGVNGKQFNAFKFRTMCQNGEEILAANPDLMEEYKNNFKLKVDPRVTGVGRFLRKTSLDELPQLVNVLINQMSLVGPRMITPEELEKYNQWDINLLTVKPGITGLWQVRGRSDVSYEERVRLDMYYIRNWTFWMDLQIIFQTIPSVIFHKGAY
jgi:exopolysaccharide biosynthesis polyprenyl glycosylphosphotransferase